MYGCRLRSFGLFLLLSIIRLICYVKQDRQILAAPSSGHQAFGGYIFKILLDYVLTHKGSCVPLMSPIDVRLAEDDQTAVQQDVLIVCDRNKSKTAAFSELRTFLSRYFPLPQEKKDMYLKLFKYMNAGVREYWVIDPVKRKVIVYRFDEDQFPALYGFDDRIKIGISGGLCEIDFHEISEEIAYLADVPEGNPPKEDA